MANLEQVMDFNLDVPDYESSSDESDKEIYMAEHDDYAIGESDDEDDYGSSSGELRNVGESENVPELAIDQQADSCSGKTKTIYQKEDLPCAITLQQDEKNLQLEEDGETQRARKIFSTCYWVKPYLGWYRVDTDGSVKVSRKKDGTIRKWTKGGYGVIVRDHSGKLICAAAGVSKPVSVLYHQLEGVKKGIDLAIACNHPRVVVYCNSRVAVTLLDESNRQLYEEVDCDEVNTILAAIDEVISKNEHVVLSIQYTNKGTNRAADYLSKLFKKIEIIKPCESGEELNNLISDKFGEELKVIISEDGNGKGYKYWI